MRIFEREKKYRTCTVEELIIALLRLDSRDLKKSVKVEGCDCLQDAVDIDVYEKEVVIGHD